MRASRFQHSPHDEAILRIHLIIRTYVHLGIVSSYRLLHFKLSYFLTVVTKFEVYCFTLEEVIAHFLIDYQILEEQFYIPL